MKRIVVSLMFIAVCVSGARGVAQDAVFRGASDTVRLFVTVTDKEGRIATNLTRDQFEVRDNGRPQPITLFDNTPQPVRMIVLIDVSGSMAGNLQLIRNSVLQLITHLRPDDAIRIGTFGDEIVIAPTFTRDPVELRAALPTTIPQAASTPLWRAIDDAITELANVEGRRVVLVLSDSKDSGPRFGQRTVNQLDVTWRSQREDVMVYGIGVRSRSNAPPRIGQSAMSMLTDNLPDPGLGTLALDSGGGYVELQPRDDLAVTFTRVAAELHSQYLLGFTPPARDGKEHKVEVRLAVRDHKTRVRKTYTAPR